VTTQTRKERPPVFIGKGKDRKRAHLGTGRRKTSVARVYLVEGTGSITINDRPHDKYFTEVKDLAAVTGPLDVTDLRNRMDVIIRVRGGGITGQAGACSQGIARALKEMFGLTTQAEPAPQEGEGAEGAQARPNMAVVLRQSGYLTRDGRMKERKKYGRKGARKAFQFSKR
jgi:small subunit ribosomal protein S9